MKNIFENSSRKILGGRPAGLVIALFFALAFSAQAQNETAAPSENEKKAAAPAANELPPAPGPKVDVTIIESEINEHQMISTSDTDPAARRDFGKTAKALNSKVFMTPGGNEEIPSEPEDQAPGLTANAKKDSSWAELSQVEIQGKQVLQLNQSLRRIIEDNEKLRAEREKLDKQLRAIRGQRTIEENRVEAAMKERDKYKKDMQDIVALNEKFQTEMAGMKADLDRKERWVTSKAQRLEKELSVSDAETLKRLESQIPGDERTLELLRYDLRAAQERLKNLQDETAKIPASESPSGVVNAGGASLSAKVSSEEPVKGDQQKSEQVLAMLDEFSQKNKKMRMDEARIHYNMGNKYFHAGDYGKAAQEYKKAVQLRPDDASAHFNLAYVCGEFTKDFNTALKHYRLYLMLNPTADDSNLVKEKIIESELILKSMFDKSITERDWQNMRSKIYTR